MLILGILRQHPKLQLIIVSFLAELSQLGDLLALKIHIRTSLIQKVDRFIRQESVCDISFRKYHALTGDLRRNGNAVELSIGLGNALHDLACLFDSRFRNIHRLETALKGGILLDMLAVLIEGSGTDDLDLTSGKGRLQDISSIHTAFRITGTHQIVDLIDHQDDIAALLDLTDQALHAALKLTAELGARNQCSKIKQEYFLIPKLVGHLACCDPLGKTFRDGRLTDTGLADQTGVILLTAVEDLDHTLRLNISADHLIQLSGLSSASQIHTVAVQEFMLGLFLLTLPILLRRFLFLRGAGRLRRHIIVSEQLIQQRERGGLTVDLVIFPVFIISLTKNTAHLVTDQVQLLFGDAHLTHGLIDLRNTQTSGTLETIAFIQCYTVLYLGDKDDGDIFLTLDAHFGLHLHPSFFKESSFRCSISYLHRKRKNKF